MITNIAVSFFSRRALAPVLRPDEFGAGFHFAQRLFSEPHRCDPTGTSSDHLIRMRAKYEYAW